MFDFLKKIQLAKTKKASFILVLEFIKKCCTGVDGILTAGTKRGEVAKQIKTTKYPDLLNAANCYLADGTSESLRNFFTLLEITMKQASIDVICSIGF